MQWPEEARTALLEAGWLHDAGVQRLFTCRDCDEECTEEVQPAHDGAFIACPRFGRRPIDPETLRHWVIRPGRIAETLGEMLGTDRGAQEMVRDRLWWLGGLHLRGQRVPIYFARGTGWRDASAIYSSVGELQSGEMQVVLVPGRVPVPGALGAGVKAVSLQQVVGLGPGGLRVDLTPIEQVVPRSRSRVARSIVPIHTPPGTTWEQVLIEFLDEEKVRVSVAGQVPQERSFVELGFQDRRQTGEQADTLWAMLCLLAKHGGKLEPEDTNQEIPAASFGKVKKLVSDTGKRLRALFPNIGGSPFKPYRRKEATGDPANPYQWTSSYETKFILCWEGVSRRT